MAWACLEENYLKPEKVARDELSDGVNLEIPEVKHVILCQNRILRRVCRYSCYLGWLEPLDREGTSLDHAEVSNLSRFDPCFKFCSNNNQFTWKI